MKRLLAGVKYAAILTGLFARMFLRRYLTAELQSNVQFSALLISLYTPSMKEKNIYIYILGMVHSSRAKHL